MQTLTIYCQYCKKEILNKRIVAKFCSNSCKQLAYLMRIGGSDKSKKYYNEQISILVQDLLKLIEQKSVSKAEISDLKTNITNFINNFTGSSAQKKTLIALEKLCDVFLVGMTNKNIDNLQMEKFRGLVLIYFDSIPHCKRYITALNK